MDEKITMRNEVDLKNWFMNNYKSLGYSRIIKGDEGRFPDFVMDRDGSEVLVELETLSSNFILHKHDPEKVHEVVCIKKDKDIGIPVIEVEGIEFCPRIRRVSATVDPEIKDKVDALLGSGKYRNKSHVIEEAIKKMEVEDGK